MPLTIRQAQVALWLAMKSHDAAHKDQDADLWEILKVKPAIREYEQAAKSTRDRKTPEIDENHATSKGLAATHSARSLSTLEDGHEGLVSADDSQGLGGGSSAPPSIIRPDNE